MKNGDIVPNHLYEVEAELKLYQEENNRLKESLQDISLYHISSEADAFRMQEIARKALKAKD